MQKKRIRRSLAFFLAVALMLSFSTLSASAFSENQIEGQQRIAKRELSISGVANKNPSAYKAVDVEHNGKNLGSIARVINGEVYIPIRQYVESTTSLKVTYYSSTGTVTVTGGGHDISVSHGAYVMYAGGRAIFRTTPSVMMNNGRMYVPLASLARALSLSYSFDSSTAKTSGYASPVIPADRYYPEDAVYWLSRIISAESRGEPLLGQIAVGSVIMNRVKSQSFPNTIWGVIFDRQYGVQFSPVANGTIYNTPPYNSVLAAKICLEGFRVSDEVLYFVAPSVVSNSWIQRTRTYAFTIGHHDFYV